jgi:hypothetical protein
MQTDIGPSVRGKRWSIHFICHWKVHLESIKRKYSHRRLELHNQLRIRESFKCQY